MVDMSAALEKLKREITCSLCLDLYEDPKLLPCLHYYCQKCINPMVLRAATGHRGNVTIDCPECRRPAEIPGNKASNLQTVFHVNRLKEVYRVWKTAQAAAADRGLCELCKQEGKTSTSFCQQCSRLMCTSCTGMHKNVPACASHDIVSIDDIGQSPTAPSIASHDTKAYCVKHQKNPLALFCNSCQSLICRDCTLVNHKDHQYDFIAEVVEKHKEYVRNSLSSVHELHSCIQKCLESIAKARSDNRDREVAIVKDIETSISQAISELQKQGHALTGKVQNAMEEMVETLGCQKTNLEMASAEIESVMMFVQNVVDTASDEEFLSVKHDMLHRIQEVMDQHRQKGTTEEQTAVVVQLPTTDKFVQFIEENTRIVTKAPPDLNKCLVEGAGFEAAEIGKTTTFRVNVVDSHARHCFGKHEVSVELKSLVDDSVVMGNILSKDVGIYEASCIPQIRGRHELVVKINGIPVVGSPFQVFVTYPYKKLGKPFLTIKGVVSPVRIVFTPQQEVLVSGFEDHRISVITKNGRQVQVISSEELKHPGGIGIHQDSIYVTSVEMSCLLKFTKDGDFVAKVGQRGKHLSEFEYPVGVRVKENELFVSDCYNDRIQVFDPDLKYLRSVSGSGEFGFNKPRALTFGADGTMYVVDTANHCIQKLQQEKLTLIFGNDRLETPVSVEVDRTNQFIFVSDIHAHMVFVYHVSGLFLTSFGGKGARAGEFNEPYGIAMDEDGFLYVCDYGNNRIQVF